MFLGIQPLKSERRARIRPLGQNKKQMRSAWTPSYANTHWYAGTSENTGTFPGIEPLKSERWACFTLKHLFGVHQQRAGTWWRVRGADVGKEGMDGWDRWWGATPGSRHDQKSSVPGVS